MVAERKPDPKDRRAKLVVPTTAGANAIDLAFRTIREIKAGYARLLRQSGHVALRDALTRLAGTPSSPRPEPRAQARDQNGERAQ